VGSRDPGGDPSPQGRTRADCHRRQDAAGLKTPGALNVHLLSALSQRLGVTLFQSAVSDKTNEIGAIQEVLSALVLEGRVVTVDALLCQRKVAEAIVSRGGTT
jgi:hypothetical protein